MGCFRTLKMKKATPLRYGMQVFKNGVVFYDFVRVRGIREGDAVKH